MTAGRGTRVVDRLAILALALAWGGVWGAWIPHKTAGLTQNAVDLAQWSGLLMDVQSGPLGPVPDLLRVGIALGLLALAVAAGALENAALRWAARIAAALPGLVLLPPYPAVLRPWTAEALPRFLIAAGLWTGIAASLLMKRLHPRTRRTAAAALAIGGAALGGWTFTLLHKPFTAHYAAPIPPGWGVAAFVGGLVIAAALEASGAARRAREAPPV
jgi:hypothetical protein